MKKILVSVFVLLIMSCGKETNFFFVLQPSPEEGKDALIAKAYPNNNYGTIDFIHMLSRIKNDSIDDDNRFLIRFELNEIPKSAIIDSAFISLYSNGKKHKGENSFLIQRINFPWADDGVTWNNKPTIDSVNQIIVTKLEKKEQDYRVNITPLIVDLINKNQRNYGFMFRFQKEVPPIKLLSFFSSNAFEAEKRPKLEVYYRVNEITSILF